MDTTYQALLTFITVIGIIDTIILILGIIYAVVLWGRGIAPVLFRLGNGLARRKIALFAKGDALSSLEHLLKDSKLFRDKNIIKITAAGDIGRAEGATVYLVHWPGWATDIDAILTAKPDQCALVVYAPYNEGRIPDD